MRWAVIANYPEPGLDFGLVWPMIVFSTGQEIRMADEFQTLYVTRYSAIWRAWQVAILAVYLGHLYYYGQSFSAMELRANIALAAFIAWTCASVFLRRTRITEQGIEYRTSIGTKRFGRWSDVVALECKGKSLAIRFGNTELKLTKAEADLNRLADLLRNRAAKYGYDV